MSHRMRNYGLCLLAAGLWACGSCGDDNNENSSTNNMSNNATTNNTSNNSNNGSNNSTNSGTNNPPNNMMTVDADVIEMEPNGFEDPWTPFDLGQTIGGEIANGAGDTSDFDVFQVTLTAGTVVQFGLQEAGPGLADTAVVVLQDEAGEIMTRVAQVSEGPAIRQAYIPVDGTYIVGVYDERAGSETEEPNGGPDSWYVVSFEEATVTPTPATVPSAQTGDQSDGTIQIFAVTPAADSVVVAEVTADRPPISSTLDSVVWVIDGATGDIVGFDDDSADAESFDSRAIFAATGGATYNVVVDSWFSTNTGAYSLDLRETDDDIQAPTDLVLGTPGAGVIDAVEGDDFDTDYFLVTLNPGETVRIVVSAAGGMQPSVTAVVNTFFGLIPFATGYPVGTDAAIEFAHSSEATDPGEYYVIVDDVRNISDPDNPGDVGEAGFTYTIDATMTTWMATSVTLPYTTAGSIPAIGNYVWYSFTIPAGHMFSATATSTNPDFVAGIATLGQDGTEFVELGSSMLFPQADAMMTMGVRDQFFRGGAGWNFTPNFRSFDVGAINFTPVVESEPNDASATAQALALPASVAGALDGMGNVDLRPDWYAVTATAGQTIGAYTAVGADNNMDDADTILTIYGADGTTVVAENDDYDGQEDSFFSAIVTTAATAGTYYVVVTPYCPDADACSGNGDYSLNVFAQ